MKAIFIIIAHFLFFSTSISAINLPCINELKAALENLKSESNSEVSKDSFLTELDRLAAAFPDERDIFEKTKIYLSQANSSLALSDLIDVLGASQEVFKSERESGTKEQLGTFLDEFLSGQKKVHNILVVGRTRSGKSTFMATVLNPLDKLLHSTISDPSIFSHTVHTKPYVQIFRSMHDGLFVARFLDTPGFFESKGRNDQVKARSDQEIATEIIDAVKKYSGAMDKVMQTMSIACGINWDDPKVLEFISRELKQKGIFNGKITLLFPNLVEKGDGVAKEQADAFKKMGPPVSNIDGLYEENILFTGTIFNNEFKYGPKAASIIRTASRVLAARNDILKNIFGADFNEYNNPGALDEIKRLKNSENNNSNEEEQFLASCPF